MSQLASSRVVVPSHSHGPRARLREALGFPLRARRRGTWGGDGSAWDLCSRRGFRNQCDGVFHRRDGGDLAGTSRVGQRKHGILGRGTTNSRKFSGRVWGFGLTGSCRQDGIVVGVQL